MRRRVLWIAGLGLVVVGGAAVAALANASTPAAPPAPPPTPIPPGGCVEQPPQSFLIRSNYMRDATMHAAAIRYRTEQYGYFPGFGNAAWNATSPAANAVSTTFFGLPVTLNRRVVPILKCVEDAIRRECGATPYTPTALSGLRTTNTFRGGEVSNHVYGIALDIDPQKNPCCGCVAPWSDNPLCRKQVASEFERMAMPKCWVDVFERYGFYWLGHDPQLRDTMHFEFLGKP